ncbi:hypothetical protein ALTERO38_50933 [Alteromonas sp. 38]|nr:hypothetical protein ALTER154_70115 [Alteromonas sp. 154]VXB53893.1 hypothetical protein ALTERO38_50933 [Alteromonas sp. 38]
MWQQTYICYVFNEIIRSKLMAEKIVASDKEQFVTTENDGGRRPVKYQFAEICRVRRMILQASGESGEQVEQEFLNALTIAHEQRVLGW